ncbi:MULTISPECIES: hypothetical protein [Actinomadura]|uniref:Mce-associated membrane protein n=1 Tax=Actinomadura yumaensis TaxID=111807 RepID=A0ABW2CG99_9ACTN|nr:hypothetical protein [Actinomadura sp. J1-007]
MAALDSRKALDALNATRWRRNVRSPVALGTAAAVLAAGGVYAYREARQLRDDPSARNTALTDSARTSEVKGEVADMVGKVFSYNFTDGARTDRAARTHLTGAAVRQYESLFGKVRTDAPKARTVLTTKVTDSAVTLLRGDRARLLVFADQRTTRLSDGKGSSAAAMLAVDAVRRDGHWRITSLDTFTGR